MHKVPHLRVMPKDATQSPEAEPDNTLQNHSDRSMKNYYEAVQPELWFSLLIIPYFSFPGIQQNLSVRLRKKARDD